MQDSHQCDALFHLTIIHRFFCKIQFFNKQHSQHLEQNYEHSKIETNGEKLWPHVGIQNEKKVKDKWNSQQTPGDLHHQ